MLFMYVMKPLWGSTESWSPKKLETLFHIQLPPISKQNAAFLQRNFDSQRENTEPVLIYSCESFQHE